MGSEATVGDEKTEDKKPRRFSQEQNEMLMRCSDAQDITEWNEWRKANRNEDILLEGADLNHAHLESADLSEAHLEKAELEGAHLEGACLRKAHLEHAGLEWAHLEGANLDGAYLQNAWLTHAHLADVQFRHTHLESADLGEANLEGADLVGAHLEGADFTDAIVDGKTLLANCTYDEETKFIGVGLRVARVRPELRSALEANVRRKKWKDWYEKHKWRGPFVRRFWAVSDYGTSTTGVLCSFAKWALIFAVLYCIPGVVSGVYEEGIPGWAAPLRALYFSVVTMTTLGFGDMHAATVFSPWYFAVASVAGHLLLMFQVMLGYVLLGALVTRLAVLFQEA